MPWGKGNEKVGQSLTGEGTEIGAPVEKEAVKTECFGRCGSKEPLLWGWSGTGGAWEGTWCL